MGGVAGWAAISFVWLGGCAPSSWSALGGREESDSCE
jgi:hypothetical protein